MLETLFDTEDLPTEDRLPAWMDLVSRSMLPSLFSVPRAESFQAASRTLDLGATQVNTLRYSSMRTHRTPKLIRRSDPELYMVALVNSRGQHLEQCGRQLTPKPRDLALYATFQPYLSRVDVERATASSVVAVIPRSMVALPPDLVTRLLAVPLSGQDGLGALLAQFLTRLAADSGSYRATDGPRLGTVLLDLFGAFLAHHLDAETAIPPESRRRTLYLEIQSFIRRHLGDPRLTLRDVAAAHHISIRQLHRLFQEHAEDGETVAGWIRRQRLEHAHRDLARPELAGMPIHAIAARRGFITPAAFSRAFRAAYGLSPRDHRHHAAIGHRPEPPPGPAA
ncbi:AraC family transcriptional regulator [Sphaerisporangium rufum]|uniref:AraC family transcriptional regulator n=1 Tax=Sphaerisporangium rufum TaxID=1381558 RepID=A0A919QYZ0_9ACTN|nr:helix-turn-helix domain-containing protein [Sphaerisporangium rufum]GII76764.1 AraC family transcriptional regulator [Sphaerisporangium rufum]